MSKINIVANKVRINYDYDLWIIKVSIAGWNWFYYPEFQWNSYFSGLILGLILYIPIFIKV